MSKPQTFRTLDAQALRLSAQAIFDQADIWMALWPDGQIIDAGFNGAYRPPADLTGRLARELVQPEDAAALDEMIGEACAGRTHAPAELRHGAALRAATAARYSAHLAADGQRVMLIGTWQTPRLSVVEAAVKAEIDSAQPDEQPGEVARYRLLFEASGEGLVFVDAAGGVVEQANGRAARLLGVADQDLVDRTLSELFCDLPMDATHLTPPPGVETVLTLTPLAPGLNTPLRVVCQSLQIQNRTVLLLRIGEAEPVLDDPAHRPIALLRHLEEPVALTDRAGLVVWANAAFAALVPNGAAVGRALADVLRVPVYAVDMMMEQSERSGRATSALKALDPRNRRAGDARVTVLPVPKDQPSGYGVVVHAMSQPGGSNAAAPDGVAADGATVDGVAPDGVAAGSAAAGGAGSDGAGPAFRKPDTDAAAKLIGQTTMKDLVSDAAELIERQCIEAALGLTGNNRAATAQVLGVSRQGLYLKLRQYGLL